MKKISVYDFDGTLTTKDSLMSIIIFQRGRIGLCWALLRQIHLILLMMAKLYSNQKCKEHLFAYCFGGMTLEAFDTLCQQFADSNRHILRQSLVEQLRSQTDREPIIISASPENWVRHFLPGVRVLSSQMEVVDGRITGCLKTPNCYGPEKVNRLLAAYPDIKTHRSDYHICAYGDSRGDREMLAFADQGQLIKGL